MNSMRKVACAAVLMVLALIPIGCGNTFRPVSTTLPVTMGNPSGAETEVVLNQCGAGQVCKNGTTGTVSASVLTDIDVSGDSNAGNRQLQNQVGGVSAGTVVGSGGSLVNIPATPMAFDSSRTSVFTANTATDSVSQTELAGSTAGFAANTTTISLPPGSAPVGISFQYFGSTYTQEYVVNPGTTTAICLGTGSLGVIVQSSDQLKATVCIGQFTGATLTKAANPVFAWIYRDQSKVFVLDNQTSGAGNVYVVSASAYKITNSFAVGLNPVKVAQSNDGQYIYVLNSGGRSISVVDGQAEQVVGPPITTDNLLTSSPPIDIAQDTNFNDTTANTQINHVWILHADGTVSVWDGSVPGQLNWITSIAAITPTQLTAGAYPTNLALLRDGTWAYVGVGNTDQIVGIDTSKLSTGTATLGATVPITVGVHRTMSATLTNTITDTTTSPATVTTISKTVPAEVTTPVVTSVAVSRQGTSVTPGGSNDLSKVYATTTTNTTYFCYDANVLATDCSDTVADPWSGSSTLVTSVPPSPPVISVPPATPPIQAPYLAAGCTDLVGQNAMSCPNLYNGIAVVTAAAQATTPINTYVTTIPAPSVVTYCNPGNPQTGEYDGQKSCPAMEPVMVLGRS